MCILKRESMRVGLPTIKPLKRAFYILQQFSFFKAGQVTDLPNPFQVKGLAAPLSPALFPAREYAVASGGKG
jgi:hypothetical protein